MDPGVILGVSALGLDPQDDSLLYAATGYWLGTSQVRFSPAAIMVSSDNGATWLPLAQVPLGSQRITSLSVDASQSLSVVATAVDGTTARYTASMDEMIAYLPAAEASPAQQAAAARSIVYLPTGAGRSPIASRCVRITGIESLPPLVITWLFTSTTGSCAPGGSGGHLGSSRS